MLRSSLAAMMTEIGAVGHAWKRDCWKSAEGVAVVEINGNDDIDVHSLNHVNGEIVERLAHHPCRRRRRGFPGMKSAGIDAVARSASAKDPLAKSFSAPVARSVATQRKGMGSSSKLLEIEVGFEGLSRMESISA